MANTYISLHYHIIFSTKNRVKHISQEIEQRVWAYIGGVARAHKMVALQVGGVEDHLHALVTAPAALSLKEIAVSSERADSRACGGRMCGDTVTAAKQEIYLQSSQRAKAGGSAPYGDR